MKAVYTMKLLGFDVEGILESSIIVTSLGRDEDVFIRWSGGLGRCCLAVNAFCFQRKTIMEIHVAGRGGEGKGLNASRAKVLCAQQLRYACRFRVFPARFSGSVLSMENRDGFREARWIAWEFSRSFLR
ncbi:hypothetical protein I3843_09G050900 [Carya illinoinensis]|nr:hypothetical protein I3843_09G050900 [Carya illinoinensis]